MKTAAMPAGDLPVIRANPPAKISTARLVGREETQLIRNLIWLYLVLWLIEGGLRRWFLPGLASPLLLVRDPVVIAIYALAISKNLFPFNGFVVWGGLLAVLSLVNALLLGHGNMFVALYGVRCDFLHIPLIFIMGKVLRPDDFIKVAKIAAWLAVPYTLLLVAQFYKPQDAWVNRGVGGSLDGAGFDGAMDRFRPPGTFSFITGPALLYPMLTACWFALMLARKFPVWIMAASGAAILVAIPISISRTLFLSVAIVAAAGVGAVFAGGRFSVKLILQLAVVVVVIYLMAGQSLVFKDGMEAFLARWEGSTDDQGGFKVAIVDRLLSDLFGSFAGIQGFGQGTGFSTNVGQQLVTQHVGFGGAESEWGRLLYDNGFALGTLLIGYRIALAGFIALAGYRAWRHRSPLGLVFAAACFMPILNGQWGQATTLGAAVIGGGLTLAAAQYQVSGQKQKPIH